MQVLQLKRPRHKKIPTPNKSADTSSTSPPASQCALALSAAPKFPAHTPRSSHSPLISSGSNQSNDSGYFQEGTSDDTPPTSPPASQCVLTLTAAPKGPAPSHSPLIFSDSNQSNDSGYFQEGTTDGTPPISPPASQCALTLPAAPKGREDTPCSSHPAANFGGINFEIENQEIVGDIPCTPPPTFDSTPIDTDATQSLQNVVEGIFIVHPEVSTGGHQELIPLLADEDIPTLRSTDSSFVVEPMFEQIDFDESHEEGTSLEEPATAEKPKRTRNNEGVTPVTTRKRLSHPDKWKSNISKAACLSGQEYVNTRGNTRRARRMGPGCDATKCKFKCHSKISLAERELIFTKFYKLSSRSAQWTFLGTHVHISKKQRETTNWDSPRQRSMKYFFVVDGQERRVCLRMFLSPLDISHMAVKTACRKKVSYSPDKRGKAKQKFRLLKENTVQSVVDHINMFPRIPSHYCRKDTKKEYLEERLNVRKMHQLYLEHMESSGSNIKLATERQYRDIFNTQFNIGFFKPKKDQCETCKLYDNATGEDKEKLQESYEEHIRKKTLARGLKESSKLAAQNDETLCVAAFDLQKILNVPLAKTSSFYYVSKISIYNLSAFDLGKGQGYSYVWTEEVGLKGSNEVSSCMLLFVDMMAAPGIIKKFCFYSDNCGGQNKNRFLYAMWLYLSVKHTVTITHRFLEVGHTQTEVDNMHGLIEKKARDLDIFVPQEWVTIIKMARGGSHAYKVKELTQEDIFDVKKLITDEKTWEFDTNGNKVRWNELREITVDPAHPYKLTLRYELDGDPFVVNTLRNQVGRPRNASTLPVLTQQLEEKLPIKRTKLEKLLKLCDKNLIPRTYHGYYKGLKPTDEVVPAPQPQRQQIEDEEEDLDDPEYEERPARSIRGKKANKQTGNKKTGSRKKKN